MKLFGREPALWLSLLGAIGVVLASLGLPFLSAGQAAAGTALIAAILIAITTRPIGPAVFTGVATAAFALFAAYGVHLPDALVGGLTAVVLAAFGLATRGQVSPNETVVSSK